MTTFLLPSIAVLSLFLAAMSPNSQASCKVPARMTAGIRGLVPDDLFRRANQGRNVFRPDGMFAFPKQVRRVVIDVGAHHLQSSRDQLTRHSDVGIVAIEPLAECWKEWPATDRLVGVPVAIFLERGTREFRVNSADFTSSLGKSVEGTRWDKYMKTVETRSVPVLRLDDVLSRIPPNIEVSLLTIDVQGFDLQVLQSAGEYLRRVRWVRAEVIIAKLYEAVGEQRPATEEEMTAYLKRFGFEFVRDLNAAPGSWLDKEYRNSACASANPDP